MTDDAREKVILDNLSMVYSLAKKYHGDTSSLISYEDLVSVGTLGLIKAVDSYCVDKGPFSSWVYLLVRQSMLCDVYRFSGFFTYGHRTNALKCICVDFVFWYGREPINAELKIFSDLVGLSFRVAMAAYDSFRGLLRFSLHQKSFLDKQIILENIEDIKSVSILQQVQLKEWVTLLNEKILGRLSIQERRVITAYYGINTEKKSLTELGEEMRTTRGKLRGIRRRLEKKIRGLLEGKI